MFVAHLSDAAEPVLTSGRVLSRHEAEPGYELPADRNALWIGDAGRDRSRSDETNAWNGLEALAAWT